MTGKEYAARRGLTASGEDFARWVTDFGLEMARGLRGEKSSLRMIPTYLDVARLPERGGPVIVLDAGGTNLRVALMDWTAEGPKAVYHETYPMLGTQGRLTIDEFYDKLAEYLAPIAAKSDRIGFCFSFPCEILPDLDGRILHFDKEVDVAGAAGSILGEGLRAALKKRGLPCTHTVAVINDTVAAMLGARAQYGADGDYVGFILGTGTNICAAFPNGAITKVPSLAAGQGATIVNLESGGFDKMARTAVDLAFDAGTATPGDQTLEKLISGAYQGPMAAAYLKDAAGEGVFTPAGGEKLSALSDLTAKEISEFLTDPAAPGRLSAGTADPADRAAVMEILDAFFRRAALLTAATLAAVLEATGGAGSPDRPVRISAEGTTFYRCPLLRKYILEDMAGLVAERGLYAAFVQADNPNLTGTALAALAI